MPEFNIELTAAIWLLILMQAYVLEGENSPDGTPESRAAYWKLHRAAAYLTAQRDEAEANG